ncbi:hypothetical protein [Marinobacter changyiensis]|uniref:hypothetical protein n=1 Tax=Marinobacter changyiensis TaxID=2604091 RepID=UPI001264C494|nr:hypothetical protein [Marinobacter changyiensis]
MNLLQSALVAVGTVKATSIGQGAIIREGGQFGASVEINAKGHTDFRQYPATGRGLLYSEPQVFQLLESFFGTERFGKAFSNNKYILALGLGAAVGWLPMKQALGVHGTDSFVGEL